MLFKKKNLYIDHFKNLSLKVKKKKIFLVSGNVSFTGNSKYFFLNALSSKINFEVYYVTYQRELFDELNSFNLPVILFHNECSLEIINKLLYAEYSFSDFDLKPDNKKTNLLHYALTNGSKKISTYHGITQKRFSYDNSFLNSNSDLIYDYFSKKEVDYFISPNKKIDNIWKDHFYDPKKIIYMGQPIHNSFKNNHDKYELINVDMKIHETVKERFNNNKINIFYCPTFRHLNTDNNYWIKEIKFREIDNYLAKQDIQLVINFHPGDPNKNIVNLRKEKFKNILISKASSDIYPSLNFSNLLITDYSAIASDYLLLEKPIALFQPDHQSNFSNLKDWDFKFYKDIDFKIKNLSNFFKNFNSNFKEINNLSYKNKLKSLKEKIFLFDNDKFKSFKFKNFINEL